MSKLVETRAMCEAYLDLIAKQFKPGVKLTLIVRSPGHDTRDFMLTTEEDLQDAVKLIQRREEFL